LQGFLQEKEEGASQLKLQTGEKMNNFFSFSNFS